MQKYTKTDQEYIDDYDRQTIKSLKEMEKASTRPIYYDAPDKIGPLIYGGPKQSVNPFTLFYDYAVKRAQNKSNDILERKLLDQRKDRMIEITSVPRNIKCNTCGMDMYHDGYIFKENDTLLLFVFSCADKHSPKRVMYPDGRREWSFPKRTCKKCGFGFESKTEEKGKLMVFTDTCLGCGDISVMELELPEPEKPIDEAERKKYCDDWKHAITVEQTFEKIADITEAFDRSQAEKKEKEEWRVDKIEKVNVPQLEQSLSKIASEAGFIKFKFDSHSTEKYLVISFSAQDPTNRDEKESTKVLTKSIKTFLLPTNWRLMSNGIDYQFGLLTGKLRAYADDEGLLKLAKEIAEANKEK